jgi:pimeloyl-ACP methyl ester carboxylesterase
MTALRRFLQRVHYIWLRVGLFLLVAMPVAAYVTFRPWGVGAEVLQSTSDISVVASDDAVMFVPASPRGSGLLLLPGCPVDPIAYTPLTRRIAERGHPAAVVKIPYRCAGFGSLEQVLDRRIAALVASRPGVAWVLAGHSRGAAHAARVAATTPKAVAAFVLMGTSHPRDLDLSQLPIDVTKIAGTNDGVAGPAQFDTARLPPSTHWVRIEGGNHAQFGYYGVQLFDHRATISREAQQQAVLEALLSVLARVTAAEKGPASF